MPKINYKKLPKLSQVSRPKMSVQVRSMNTLASKRNDYDRTLRVHHHYYKKSGGKRTLRSFIKSN
jgi:hypothetical protein